MNCGIKRKNDILKNEIEKYRKSKRVILISKINSVNEALSDTNILTNVFENKVENKVNVLTIIKLKKNFINLNENKIFFSDKKIK